MLEPQSHEQRNENKTSEAFHGQAATFIIAWADTNYCSKIPALDLPGFQPLLEILCRWQIDGWILRQVMGIDSTYKIQEDK